MKGDDPQALRRGVHKQLRLLEDIRQLKQTRPETSSPTLLEVVRTFNFVARTR